MNTDWTRLLRKKMHEHQGAPLPIDWAQIDALADQKAVNCRGRSYGRVQAWQWLSAAAVLLLMVSGASLYFFAVDTPKDVSVITATHNRQIINSYSNTVGGNDNHEIDVLAEGKPANKKQPSPTNVVKQEQDIIAHLKGQSINEHEQDQHANEDIQDQRLTENTKSNQSTVKKQVQRTIRNEQHDHLLLADAGDAHKRGRMSLQVSASPNMSNRDNTMGVLPVAGLYGDAPSEMNTNDVFQFAGEEVTPQSSEKHHQPLRFTLACTYPLSDRVSLSTGFSYSYLYSELSHRAKGYSSEGKQRLHFIGVPVSVNWHFFSAGKLGLYLSAGTMAEKMVDGSVSSIERNGTNTIKKGVSISHGSLYWSVNTSLGIDYGFHPSLSLFGEIGASHYFSCPSTITSYYSENPNSIQLNIGVRFSIQ